MYCCLESSRLMTASIIGHSGNGVLYNFHTHLPCTPEPPWNKPSDLEWAMLWEIQATDSGQEQCFDWLWASSLNQLSPGTRYYNKDVSIRFGCSSLPKKTFLEIGGPEKIYPHYSLFEFLVHGLCQHNSCFIQLNVGIVWQITNTIRKDSINLKGKARWITEMLMWNPHTSKSPHPS